MKMLLKKLYYEWKAEGDGGDGGDVWRQEGETE